MSLNPKVDDRANHQVINMIEKASQLKQAPIQRLEAGEGGTSMMPPAFNLTAANASKIDDQQPELSAQKNMAGQDTNNMEHDEQVTMATLSQAISGESEDVMTMDSMPLQPGQVSPKIYHVFNFKGVQFVVYDVGGDEKANSRKMMRRAIKLLEGADTYDYEKQKPTKKIRLFIGDYKAMQSYIKANPQMPYEIWLERISKYRFGKPFAEFDKKGNNNNYDPRTMGISFVSSCNSKKIPLEKQKEHHAAFLDMSQLDKFAVKKNDPILMQALNLAYVIAHEGTHTLMKDGGHSSGLMAEGGAMEEAVKKAMVKDPKTGKQKLSIQKYMDTILEMISHFGEKF